MKDIRIIFKCNLKALIKKKVIRTWILLSENTQKKICLKWFRFGMKLLRMAPLFRRKTCLRQTRERCFFAGQTFSAIAEDVDTGKVYGLYILHPNNVGRCSHICNASYAVRQDARGLHIGENWCRIAWCKERHTVLASCNLMRSLLRTFMPGICMNGWDLCSLA